MDLTEVVTLEAQLKKIKELKNSGNLFAASGAIGVTNSDTWHQLSGVGAACCFNVAKSLVGEDNTSHFGINLKKGGMGDVLTISDKGLDLLIHAAEEFLGILPQE